MPAQVIDTTLLIILAFNTFQGLRRGLVRAIFDIAAFSLAIGLAIVWHEPVSLFLSTTFHLSADSTQIYAPFLIWLVVYLGTMLVGNLLHHLIHTSILGPLNFISGGLLGLVKGVLLIALGLQFYLSLPLPQDLYKPLHASQVVKWMLPLAATTAPLFSPNTTPLPLKSLLPHSSLTPTIPTIPPLPKHAH